MQDSLTKSETNDQRQSETIPNVVQLSAITTVTSVQIHANVKYLDRPEKSLPADQIQRMPGTSSYPIGYPEYQTHRVQAFQRADDQCRRRIDFAPEGHLSGNYSRG
ncbi:hypothetical protein ABOM_004209 [Aspergillus bombycis]|uniref:Uncharacterized protein n=1 Tax=Aspergillus bombycis TaxID=109264 RepID=A0A1F8A782_9EURO|nr:hypothetical protein ABOM_004209 [Aspergillus bombycis]OGM47543.1 hypothetical protein ABOM_004209 [Aspergillus bombycis]